MSTAPQQRFDGAIAGLGTTSGTRLVVGLWPSSPFGPITDVMVERADGHRVLIAPTAEVAEFIASTYGFDEVRVEPTVLSIDRGRWDVRARTLHLRFTVGRRTALGLLLSAVPRRLARNPRWVESLDPVASRVRPGVHTVGTAGQGRREWYCALDEHAVVRAAAVLDGLSLGTLTTVEPSVRFGFASTPRRPSLVRVTTYVADVMVR